MLNHIIIGTIFLPLIDSMRTNGRNLYLQVSGQSRSRAALERHQSETLHHWCGWSRPSHPIATNHWVIIATLSQHQSRAIRGRPSPLFGQQTVRNGYNTGLTVDYSLTDCSLALIGWATELKAKNDSIGEFIAFAVILSDILFSINVFLNIFKLFVNWESKWGLIGNTEKERSVGSTIGLIATNKTTSTDVYIYYAIIQIYLTSIQRINIAHIHSYSQLLDWNLHSIILLINKTYQ